MAALAEVQMEPYANSCCVTAVAPPSTLSPNLPQLDGEHLPMSGLQKPECPDQDHCARPLPARFFFFYI